MTSTKWMAAVAAAGLVAQSGVAAVRPSVAPQLAAAPAQLTTGARVGTVTKGHRSNIAQGVALGALAAAGAGVGIAAAAGAFDSNKKVSP